MTDTVTYVSLLFIAGQGRSGSTLTERLLGGLPGVCALGEATHVWQEGLYERERCACGARFSACHFWRAVGERAFGGWGNVDRARIFAVLCEIGYTRQIPALIRPSRRRLVLIEEFVDHQSRVYAAAAAVAGARVVIDSSKYSALAYCLRWAPDLDLRVVHLVRDPRGVAYSWTKHVARPETDGATMAPRYRPVRSAARWSAQNAAVDLLSRLGRHDAGRLPRKVPVRRIRYEDLIADPRGTIRTIATFADVQTSPPDLRHIGDGHVDLGPVHSASGNPMRFTVGRIPLRRDDDWRSRLPVRHRRMVGAICTPLLAAYGYPPFHRAP